MNKVIIIGRVGKDPEKGTAQNVNFAKFSVATTEYGKDDQGNKKEYAEWHSIIAWRKLAEICGSYLKKGSLVAIEGKLKTRKWVDKNQSAHYNTDIIAESVNILSSPSLVPGLAPQPSPKVAQKNEFSQNEFGETGDDLPF